MTFTSGARPPSITLGGGAGSCGTWPFQPPPSCLMSPPASSCQRCCRTPDLSADLLGASSWFMCLRLPGLHHHHRHDFFVINFFFFQTQSCFLVLVAALQSSQGRLFKAVALVLSSLRPSSGSQSAPPPLSRLSANARTKRDFIVLCVFSSHRGG